MAGPSVLKLDNPTFKLADTEAGLAAGEAFQCQMTSATLVPTTSKVTVPATGCAPASSTPNQATWGLQLAWLQDWQVAGGGLSGYAYTEEGELKWFQLIVDLAGFPLVVAKGQVWVTPAAYGGVFGGAPAVATVTWDCADKPVITPTV